MRWQLASQGGQEMPEMLLVDNQRLLGQNASHALSWSSSIEARKVTSQSEIQKFQKPFSLLFLSVTRWH